MKLQDIRFGTKALTIFLALMPFSGASASIGNADGGGGKGVVCRTANGAIKSVELLDIWEAKNLFGRKILKSNKPINVQIGSAIAALKNISDGESDDWSDKNHTRESEPEVAQEKLEAASALFLKSNGAVQRLHNITLNLTDDSYEPAHPSACNIEQIVNFADTSAGARVLVNQDLVDKMDLTNQAALIVHEALYRYLRIMSGDKNSLRVRRAVGYVFAGNSFQSVSSMVGTKYVSCETANVEQIPIQGYSRLYFYSAPNGNIRVVDAQRLGQLPVGFFPGEQYAFASYAQLFENQGQACNDVNSVSVGNVPHPLLGPIDFQTFGAIAFGCDHGKTGLWITPKFIGPAIPAEAQQLTCKYVDKTK